MNELIIWTIVWIILSEIVFIRIRLNGSKDKWTDDKGASFFVGIMLTIFIWAIYKVGVYVNISLLDWINNLSLLILITVCIFAFLELNRWIASYISKIKKGKK